MSAVGFLVMTIVIGTLFAFALLWAIAQWVNTFDELKEAKSRLEEVAGKEERRKATV
ncbi:MAG: hypothetical protein V3W28_04330 [Thermoplasmata archaeon]